jgi:transcription initiation factor IIE alpha subunit
MRFRDFTLFTLLSIRLMSRYWEALRRSSFFTTNENYFNLTPCCPVRYSFSFSFLTDINLSN